MIQSNTVFHRIEQGREGTNTKEYEFYSSFVFLKQMEVLQEEGESNMHDWKMRWAVPTPLFTFLNGESK